MTEQQKQQAEILIAKYGFCSLETQQELEKAGFFEICKPSHVLVEDSSGKMVSFLAEDVEFLMLKEMEYIPMPQFHEVWGLLPTKIDMSKYYVPSPVNKHNAELFLQKQRMGYCELGNDISIIDVMFNNKIVSICESACWLWLQLKKDNLI